MRKIKYEKKWKSKEKDDRKKEIERVRESKNFFYIRDIDIAIKKFLQLLIGLNQMELIKTIKLNYQYLSEHRKINLLEGKSNVTKLPQIRPRLYIYK